MPCRPTKIPTGRLRFVLPGSNPGLLEDGNIDLWRRPFAHNGDGSISTVKSTSWEVGGNEVLMPQVIRRAGRTMVVGPRAALAEFERTGQHLGIFNSIRNANVYSIRLHNQQARIYCLLRSR